MAKTIKGERTLPKAYIEIDYNNFNTTALIDTYLCGNKSVVSLNLCLSHVRSYWIAKC